MNKFFLVRFKKIFWIVHHQSLHFIGAGAGVGAGAGEKIPEAGQKQTGFATLQSQVAWYRKPPSS